MRPLERLAAAAIALLARPRPFHAVMAGYYLVIAVLTATLFVGASIDTTEQMMFAQAWALRYDDANPPLFTWLVKIAELALGPGIGSVSLVRFGCLWAMHAFLHALGRTLRLSPELTVLVALSPLTLYYLAWDATYTYSHSLLLVAACCAGAWATAALLARPDWRRFALLGAILGFGLLTKYNFGLFAVGLVAGLALHPAARRRGLLVSLLCVVPALALVAIDTGRLEAAATDRLAIGAEPDLVAVVGGLLPQLLQGLWQCLLPALPLYALVFWPALVRRPERPVPEVAGILGWALGIAAAVMLIGLIAAKATTVRTPYLFVLILLPAIMVLRLAGYPRLGRAVRLFVLAPLAVMLAVPPAIAVKAAVESDSCRRCFLALDYAALADQLRRSGFTAGTIVGQLHDRGRVAGLRPYFPGSRLISLRYQDFVPPDRPGDEGECALVWYRAPELEHPEASVLAFAARVLGSPPPANAAPVSLRLPIGRDGTRALPVQALVWTPAGGRCR